MLSKEHVLIVKNTVATMEPSIGPWQADQSQAF